MKNPHEQRRIHWLAVVLAVLSTTLVGTAQDKSRDREKDKDKETPTEGAAPAPAKCVEEMSPQVKEIQGWANDFSKEIAGAIEGWVATGAVTEDRLFSYLYYPELDTDPLKYTTDYGALADRDFPPILEKYVSKSNMVVFAVASDRNGYVPTHNRQFSQPATGNRGLDLVNSRARRMYGDQTSFAAARNRKPHLLQPYARDTGELLGDLSVPVTVRGRHWGCVRIGFRQVDK